MSTLLANPSPEKASTARPSAAQTTATTEHQLPDEVETSEELIENLLHLIESGAVTSLSDVTSLLHAEGASVDQPSSEINQPLPLTGTTALGLPAVGVLSSEFSAPGLAEPASEESWEQVIELAQTTTQAPKPRRKRRSPTVNTVIDRIEQGQVTTLEELSTLLGQPAKRSKRAREQVDGSGANSSSPLALRPTLEEILDEATDSTLPTLNQQAEPATERRTSRLQQRRLEEFARESQTLNQRGPGLTPGAGLTPLGAPLTGPNSLYANLGWTDSSDMATNTGPSSVISQKLLEIVEATTSNRFEVDFNRIQPGTIITNLPITITQSGFYYLIHDLTNTTINGDGIIINVDEVTLDLMGYTLYGGVISGIASDDGIFVSGDQDNITIRNGSVVGWNGDGINALNADFSIFQNLHVARNEGDGLVTDFNCLISQVAAISNGMDGIEGDDGTVIIHSTAQANGDNGIQTSEGCHVALSAAFDNETDGIDVAAGSQVRNCSSTDNQVFGFDVALGGSVVDSTAYDNVSNGFDMASACVMQRNISSLNNGHGVRTFANSWIRNSKFHENDLDGIRISSTDTHVDENNVTDNDQTGLAVTASGSMITRNVAAGNLTNYNLDSNDSFGPIVNVTGVGDITGTANSNHPWANFEF